MIMLAAFAEGPLAVTEQHKGFELAIPLDWYPRLQNRSKVY
jgi:hypothetical protein